MNLAVRYGVILAIISIILSLVGQVTGLQITMGWLFTVLSIVVYVGVLHLAMVTAKKQTDDFPFGKAFGLGIRVALIAGLITSVYTAIGAATFLKDFFAQATEAQRAEMLANGMAEDQVDQALEMAANFQSPAMIFVFGLLGSLLIGAIVSAILAAINKKSEKIDG